MAQSAKKKSSSKNGGKKPAAKASAAGQKKPIRREVGAIVCFFLGIFSFIGYFQVDALFINVFCAFIKGLVGWGYYIFPPVLFLTAFILFFHRGRPVTFPLISALLLPILLGAFAHLLFCKMDTAFFKGVVGELYASGKAMTSGGVLSGLLSIGTESVFSIYGAVPVFLVLFFFFAFSALRIRLSTLIAYFRGHSHPPYEPEPEVEAPPTPAKAPSATQPAKAARRTRQPVIDIPLDEEIPEDKLSSDATEGKAGFFNNKPNVKTPDQFFTESKVAIPTEAEKVPRPVKKAVPVGTTADSAETIEPSVQVISEPPVEKPAEKLKKSEVEQEMQDISRSIETAAEEEQPAYVYPSVELLNAGSAARVDGKDEIATNKERLESTIHSFGVNASICDVTRGPTVTRYDIELEAGVKLTKLTNLSNDLALALGVASVRIAPIPDKISTVGIEVPNKLVSSVMLRDIIESPAFQNAQSRLSFAIGKNIAGDAIVGNIAKLPHMLIAGTTGSGKSVCMNSLILSLLYKATPDEVRLIMIDPKMVELGIYNGIPHLYIPVVTEPKKAAGALQWAVVEMMKRYRSFSEIGVRDLVGYNNAMKKRGENTIPQVVIVIDELADLMMVASKEVEESICRIAQMGRAAGMHLVIATQRPSADVITGLMKANIPSRIAFAVASAMESRIILDAPGAEKLIGAGDMLYSPLGSSKPMRVQGTFVTDEEREEVINFVKSSGEASYDEEILAEIEKAGEGKGGTSSAEEELPSDGDALASEFDEMLPQAVDVVVELGQASTSMLQRKLKLGYSRAARIVDQMEELGYVGPFEGAKPRKILITKTQWQEMKLQNGSLDMSALQEQLAFEDMAASEEPEEEE